MGRGVWGATHAGYGARGARDAGTGQTRVGHCLGAAVYRWEPWPRHRSRSLLAKKLVKSVVNARPPE